MVFGGGRFIGDQLWCLKDAEAKNKQANLKNDLPFFIHSNCS